MNSNFSLLLILVFTLTDSYNILIVFPFFANSHYVLYGRLFQKLVSDGHNVTLVSYFPTNTTIHNYRDVSLKKENTVTKEMMSITQLSNSQWFRWWYYLVLYHEYFEMNCRTVNQNENFRKFMKEENEFDLILMQYFMSDCFLGLVKKYNVPYIGKFAR